jgi:hypothetical protein
MFALLGKPGYESEKEKLEKQLGLWYYIVVNCSTVYKLAGLSVH